MPQSAPAASCRSYLRQPSKGLQNQRGVLRVALNNAESGVKRILVAHRAIDAHFIGCVLIACERRDH